MIRLLLLVGTVQGWLLWALWKARELKVWPAVDPLSERALLYACLALPLAFYLTQHVEALTRRRRSVIVIGLGSLFALLGAYSGWAEYVPSGIAGELLKTDPVRPADLFAAAILGFVAIPLWLHFDRSNKRWRYHALFETAWRNVLMISSSVALTGIFWIVLFAGAMLMKSIGLNYFIELIVKPIFSIPVSSIVFAAAFSLGLARAEMIVTLRRFWLSISAWLLPLLLLFSVMWMIALPFTGLDLLFETRHAGYILLWFLVLSINFANAAYQDGRGEQPYGRWLGMLLEYAWLSLLVLAAVAWWAMQLRIAQYGWTEDRVWGVFVLLLVTLYTAGYAWSVRLGYGWLANIGKTNIVTALLMCVGLLMLLSPLADARRIAVNSQMSRVMSGELAADKFDYAYLRWQAGRYGHAALLRMEAGIEHKDREIFAAKARQMLAQKNRYGRAADEDNLTSEQLRQRLRVVPKGEVLDDALLGKMLAATQWQQKRCLGRDTQCLVWMVDLNGDGLKEAVLITEKPDWSSEHAIFYHHLTKNNYKYGGTIEFGNGEGRKRRANLIADIESGKVKMLAPRYQDIAIGGRRINVTPAPCDNDCGDQKSDRLLEVR